MKNSTVFVGLLCTCIGYTVFGYPSEEKEEEGYNDLELMDSSAEDSYDDVEMRSQYDCRPCNRQVINYLNKKISATLEEYPKKSPCEVALDSVYNGEREKLANAFISKVNPLSNCKKADMEMKKFHDFVYKFNEIRRRIWAASEQLNKINNQPECSAVIKNEALKLKIALRETDSLKTAEIVLEQYERFLKQVQFGWCKEYKPTEITEVINDITQPTQAPEVKPGWPIITTPDKYKELLDKICLILARPKPGNNENTNQACNLDYSDYTASVIASLL